MKIKSLSKQEARKYKPTGKTLMISIQEHEKKIPTVQGKN